MSTASHPEADDQAERANRVVEDVLRSFASSFTSWSSFLPKVEFAINNAEHAPTGLTPFYMNFGRHPRVSALLGVKRSNATSPNTDQATLPPTPSDGVDPSPTSVQRESAHADGIALLNGVTPRRGATASASGMRTRAATRVAPEQDQPNTGRRPAPLKGTRATPRSVTDWTSRTLISPAQRRRSVEYRDVPDVAVPVAPIPANFAPLPTPQHRGTAAVHAFLQQRESATRYGKDAIAAVDRQKEYTDRRGSRNVETFAVGDCVLLSTAGIQPSTVTNLSANKLAPRFIGPFKVTKVLGDVYTSLLPTALRFHPTSYVGRLRRYCPVIKPSASDNPRGCLPPLLMPLAPGVEAQAQRPPARGATPPSRVPVDPAVLPRANDSEQPLPSPAGHATRFQGDGPTPLVDSADYDRHIVEVILRHNDHHAAPQRARTSRGKRIRDDLTSPHRQYLACCLGPMPDSWGASSGAPRGRSGLRDGIQGNCSSSGRYSGWRGGRPHVASLTALRYCSTIPRSASDTGYRSTQQLLLGSLVGSAGLKFAHNE